MKSKLLDKLVKQKAFNKNNVVCYLNKHKTCNCVDNCETWPRYIINLLQKAGRKYPDKEVSKNDQ